MRSHRQSQTSTPSYQDPPPLKFDICQSAGATPHKYEKRVQVVVIEAHHVPSTHRYGRQASAFVTVNFQASPSEKTQALRTDVADGLAPRFGNRFIFGYDPAQETKATLYFSLEDRNASIVDETMGQSAVLQIHQLLHKPSHTLEGWLDLSTHNVVEKRFLRATEDLAHSQHVSQVRVVVTALPSSSEAPAAPVPPSGQGTRVDYDTAPLAATAHTSESKSAFAQPFEAPAVEPGEVGLLWRDAIRDIPGRGSQVMSTSSSYGVHHLVMRPR